MKINRSPFLSALLLISFCTFLACTPKKAAAEDPKPILESTSQASVSSLRTLGFHIFDKPVDIPSFSVISLGNSSDGLKADSTLLSQDLTGKITILNFWATWCPPCKREMPSIQRLYEQMQGTDFQIVAISAGENKSTVANFIQTNKYTFPVYLDEKGSVSASFASQGIPTTYIVDKSGKIVAGIVGSHEYDSSELISVLKGLAAQ